MRKVREERKCNGHNATYINITGLNIIQIVSHIRYVVMYVNMVALDCDVF